MTRSPWVLIMGLVAESAFAGTYAEVKTLMYDLAAKHPKNAKVFILGKSDSGENIEGLEIGNGPVNNLIVATHHGNEYGATEVAKALAASLAAAPIQGQTVHLIPVLNISGYNSGRRREAAGTRTYDANRDYPGPCGTEGPFKLKSTFALANFIEQKNIVASATLHTFTPAILYPWGISTKDISTPYDGIFIDLGRAAAIESGYTVGNSTALLYPADGTFEDYAFWKHGIWSLLMELGHSHSPGDSAIAEMIRVNVPGIRRFLEQAPRIRAEKFAFTGKCDPAMKRLDRHDE